MNKTLFLMAALLAPAAGPASAGTWTKVSPEVIRFEGEIGLDEYEKFAKVFSPSIREIIVTSGGGVTSAGIKIGQAIAASDVKVTVVKECLSSCANYLFVAGRRREIKHGVVGYHGNVQACFGGSHRAEQILEMKKKYNMSDEDIARNMAEQDREIEDEARFLRNAGVSQDLFDRTCTEDKGLHDGGHYAFLLPKKATFEKYGLHGIIGGQDPAVMKSLTWRYAFD